MKRLYFIRHGLSEQNVAGRFAGITETPLTDVGREQAKEAGQYASQLSIDCIVSSPLSRALETAQIIAQEIDYPQDAIYVNKLFIERNYGELEGKIWDQNLNLNGLPSVESATAILKRAEHGLEFLYSLKASNLLVVSHGAIGRALRSLVVSGMPFDNHGGIVSRKSKPIPNAQIVKWL